MFSVFFTVTNRIKGCFDDWKLLEFLQNRLPITKWLVHYKWKTDLVSDVVAGITVAVMHIPQGTFAVVCLMTGKSVAAYSSEPELIMYVFRLGIVCTLLSDTLVNGFTTGAAIHVLTSQIKDLLDSFTITMVAYTIAMSMALIFGQKKNYEVDSNQELFAQGASNVVGSFFSCMPITASLSRSMVQETVGGRTQLTSFISCIILLFVMLWIGPFFEPLPRCILASIIVVALKGMLMQATELPKFWRLSTIDGLVWLLTFLTVVLVDIDYGLLVGLVLSLATILIQAMKPYTCLLGVLPNLDIYLDCKRYKEAREIPGIKIFHYGGGLNFATRSHFRNQVFELVGVNPQKELARRKKLEKRAKNTAWANSDQEAKVQCIILDFSALSYIDPSGVNTLKLLNTAFTKIDIIFYLAGISGKCIHTSIIIYLTLN
ncbi:hypothetical protein C0J52_09156 [Blattella germanica]|nr:hypothetical protein C0J52_09156 [Blattella germanica]